MSKKSHIVLIVVLAVILIGLLAFAMVLFLGNGRETPPVDETQEGNTASAEATDPLKDLEETFDPVKESSVEGEETQPEKPMEEETVPALTTPVEETTQPTQPEEPTRSTTGTMMPDDEF